MASRPNTRPSASIAMPSRYRWSKARPTSKRSSSPAWLAALRRTENRFAHETDLNVTSRRAQPRAGHDDVGELGMRPYFETMPSFGKELKENRISRTQESRAKLEAVEAEIGALYKARWEVGVPTAEINKRGSLTVWQRIEYLVDKGSFLPLHTLYNPGDNEEGTTNV